MTIWFFIWLGIALILLYFMGWNMLIAYRQKQAWKAFADRESLRFKKGGFSDSPEMSGAYRDYTVSLFTGEHVIANGRTGRKLAAIELQLSSHMPFEGALASGGMVPLVRDLQFNEEVKPTHKSWKKDYIASSNTPFALRSYLSDARIDALMSLVRVKNAWVIFVFKGDTSLLRFDTADPLDDVDKITAVVNRMVEAAKILELEAGESKVLKEEMARTSPKEKALQIDEDSFEGAGVGFELDDGEDVEDDGA